MELDQIRMRKEKGSERDKWNWKEVKGVRMVVLCVSIVEDWNVIKWNGIRSDEIRTETTVVGTVRKSSDKFLLSSPLLSCPLLNDLFYPISHSFLSSPSLSLFSSNSLLSPLPYVLCGVTVSSQPSPHLSPSPLTLSYLPCHPLLISHPVLVPLSSALLYSSHTSYPL